MMTLTLTSGLPPAPATSLALSSDSFVAGLISRADERIETDRLSPVADIAATLNLATLRRTERRTAYIQFALAELAQIPGNRAWSDQMSDFLVSTVSRKFSAATVGDLAALVIDRTHQRSTEDAMEAISRVVGRVDALSLARRPIPASTRNQYV